MIDYTLRKAVSGDLDLSFEIRKDALGKYVEQTWGWDEKWQLKYHKDDFNLDILKIIEVNGKPAGSLETSIDDDVLIISGLYITSKYQNCKIGTRIMNDLINEALIKKQIIRLQVLKVNSGAKKLYENLGFIVYEENITHYKMIYKPVE